MASSEGRIAAVKNEPSVVRGKAASNASSHRSADRGTAQDEYPGIAPPRAPEDQATSSAYPRELLVLVTVLSSCRQWTVGIPGRTGEMRVVAMIVVAAARSHGVLPLSRWC